MNPNRGHRVLTGERLRELSVALIAFVIIGAGIMAAGSTLGWKDSRPASYALIVAGALVVATALWLLVDARRYARRNAPTARARVLLRIAATLAVASLVAAGIVLVPAVMTALA